MSLPKSHVASLESHVRIHEERLAALREQLKNTPTRTDPNPKGDPNPKPPLRKKINLRDVLKKEIHFHEQLIELARDPKVRRVLGDLMKDPEFASEAALDPRAAAHSRGIELPAGVTLRLDSDADRVRLRVSSYESLYPFMVTWDSESGFSPVPEPDAPRHGA
jgi:hypothetical protein